MELRQSYRYIESDREVADIISAPIGLGWSDCTGGCSLASTTTFQDRNKVVPTGAAPSPCSLISCVLLAQNRLPQTPCHSLSITFYFTVCIIEFSQCRVSSTSPSPTEVFSTMGGSTSLSPTPRSAEIKVFGSMAAPGSNPCLWLASEGRQRLDTESITSFKRGINQI